ncbi:LysR family transcriptional regulator [Cupriavidus sp. TA19]|uniref:LysR substrate-binding domain-containing protein n=1 Tax=unclassified Cupriavidus TaxID=2640874 RepID=UPI000E2EB893|nr:MULTISPECIES: LysR substrate-binding domain-containing protein [unclassified Cupriavidus]BDB27032.1 LysR family transcriptional regulator [Cupriavidus sp. P-10]GLC90803.1 LysR family transcriptional regulator [Cupriavidus sp. TA19]
MELAELEIFQAVAREQSITRAAKTLERVQSNVTTRIKQLEESLGVALFQRDSKKMILTPEGQRLLGYAEQLLALAEEARQSMRTNAPSGRLRLGSMESSAATLLPKPLGRYHAAWPDVELTVTTGTTQFLVDAVLAHRLDCAVVAHPGTGAPRSLDVAALGEGLDGVFLRTEELVLVLPATHPKVRQPRDVTLRHLAAFARGCTYRQCAEAWLEAGGEEMRRRLSVVEMPSYHAIFAYVSAGSAVGIVPRSLLALHPDAAEFHTVPIRPVHTFLVRRSGFSTSGYEAFLRELRHD